MFLESLDAKQVSMTSCRSRKENLERAKEHESAGNSRAAFECYQKAVDITPRIAFELIQVKEQIPCIFTKYLPPI